MNSKSGGSKQIAAGSEVDIQSELEPNAPSISNLPQMMDDKQRVQITETEGYKAGMKLLQLVFQEDREEITKQALLHADTLQEGL